MRTGPETISNLPLPRWLLRALVAVSLTSIAGIALPAFASGPTHGSVVNVHKPQIYLAAVSKAKAATVPAKGKKFDHLLTGFPLFGAHTQVPCGTCHIRGVLKGTPRQCDQCHGGPGMRGSTFKPVNHVRTQLPCDQCHNQTIWSGARFDHAAIAMGTCTQCHNGSTAPGKPASGHPTTTASCDTCHRTTSWLPAHFDHSGVAPGTCLDCHGSTAQGLPSGHWPTTASCDQCHSTRRWIPATFDHTGAIAGKCNDCHLPDKPSGHFVETTERSCDVCHNSTSTWGSRSYSHTGAYWPGTHRSSVTCDNCHKGLEVLPWPNPADKAFCGGCHKSNYRSDPHTKYGNVKYTYDDLKDCTGACHIYTDSTLTTIKDSRPGPHHHPSDGAFGD
jgi:hypothetical protein